MKERKKIEMNFLAIATMIIEMYSSVAGLASHYDTLSAAEKSRVLGSEVKIMHELERKGITLDQMQRDDFYELLRNHGLCTYDNEKENKELLGQFFYGCERKDSRLGDDFEQATDKIVNGYSRVCHEAEAMGDLTSISDRPDSLRLLEKVVGTETGIMRSMKSIGTIRHSDLGKRDLFIKNLRKHCRNRKAIRRYLQSNLRLNGYRPDKVAGKHSFKESK